VACAIEAAGHHQPAVKVIAIEDTHMASGGRVWDASRLAEVAALAEAHGVVVHMDGARLWNAAVASGGPVAARSRYATTVMCCLSKGLGAPVGSLLAGPASIIEEAVLHRKRLGGAMRQAGVIAAAGLVAIRTGFERLAEDHARALRLAGAVADRWPQLASQVGRVDTNIVVFSPPDPGGLLDHLRSQDILAGTIAPGVVRLVTHVDVDDDAIERACRALACAP
jgi:threonine aldolase